VLHTFQGLTRQFGLAELAVRQAKLVVQAGLMIGRWRVKTPSFLTPAGAWDHASPAPALLGGKFALSDPEMPAASQPRAICTITNVR
jgi:hypothetical protein